MQARVTKAKVARTVVPALTALAEARQYLAAGDHAGLTQALDRVQDALFAIEDECGSVTPLSLFV